MSDEIVLRPSVRQFAEMMEMTLRKHDATKGGQETWRGMTLGELYSLMLREVGELGEVAIDSLPLSGLARGPAECVDVANFAMMIADNIKNYGVDDA